MSHGQGPNISTLADLFGGIVALFAAVSDPTVIYVGERHLKREGKPGRIIFVSDTGSVASMPKLSAGYVSGVSLGFTAYVWGKESSSNNDLLRYVAADALVDRLINALSVLAPGRLTPGTIQRAKDTHILTYGEEYQVRFTYSRGVARDAALWAVDMTAVSPPDADRPQGDTGYTFEIDAAVTPSR